MEIFGHKPTVAFCALGVATTILDSETLFSKGNFKTIAFLTSAVVGGVFAFLIQAKDQEKILNALSKETNGAMIEWTEHVTKYKRKFVEDYKNSMNYQNYLFGILPSLVAKVKNWSSNSYFEGFRLGYLVVSGYQYWKFSQLMLSRETISVKGVRTTNETYFFGEIQSAIPEFKS